MARQDLHVRENVEKEGNVRGISGQKEKKQVM